LLPTHPPDAPHTKHRAISGAAENWTNKIPRAIDINPVMLTHPAEIFKRFRRDVCERSELPAPARIMSGPVPAPKRLIVSNPSRMFAELVARARYP
jgi:hypothetical protein